MALTQETIKANEVLSSLTDDQISAISTLSANDEDLVMKDRIGKLHGDYDKDINGITGIEKLPGEKTYDYNKRVLNQYKSTIESSNQKLGEINKFKDKVSELEGLIASGKGSEAIAQKLKDTEGKLSQLQSQYDSDKKNWEDEKSKFSREITKIQVDTQFEKATSSLKFKAGYSQKAQNSLIEDAKRTILSTANPDWTEENGKKVMVFRNEKGEILRNKNNMLNPYTIEELISEQLKDELDKGKQTSGAGTIPSNESTSDIVDLAGANTQVLADKIITKHLMQIGLVRGTKECAEKQSKLRTENGVDKLPMR